MTTLLEKAISIIAPHSCLSCCNENNLLCISCSEAAKVRTQLRCFSCGLASVDYAACATCRPQTALSHLYLLADYKDAVAQLVRQLKYDGARQAAEDVADAWQQLLPVPIAHYDALAYVPTSPRRARQRSYDQARLLAQAFAKRSGLPCYSFFERVGAQHQVGADRQQRLRQAADMFLMNKKLTVQATAARILLVDDVYTTGATLAACASLLKQAGARSVAGLVIARK